MATMISVQVPREIIHATRMSVDELKRELALTLFQQGKLSFENNRYTKFVFWARQTNCESNPLSH